MHDALPEWNGNAESDDSATRPDLRLRYDRADLNDTLHNALRSARVTLDANRRLNLEFDEAPATASAEFARYRDGLAATFAVLQKRAAEKAALNPSVSEETRPFHERRAFLHLGRAFLHNISFCVIRALSEEDGYTLFEVMNDRSAPVDDHAIIKNYFYRKFVATCNLPNKSVGQAISEADKLWSEAFPTAAGTLFKRSLILRLGLTFIGGTEVQGEGRRGTSPRQASKQYIQALSAYPKDTLKRDFRVFSQVSHLLNKAEVAGNNKDKTAFSVFTAAVDSQGPSWTRKVLLVLDALGLEGPMAGLVNIVLCAASEYPTTSERNNFLQVTVSNAEATKSHAVAKLIDEFSFYLLNCVLAFNDFKRPYEIFTEQLAGETLTKAMSIRQTFDTGRLKSAILAIKYRLAAHGDDGPCQWLKQWSFRNSKQDKLRVRLLFFRMLAECDSHTFKEQPDLDHCEPQNPKWDDPDSSLRYFGKDNPQRDALINGLGNMMLLPPPPNRGLKLNSPIQWWETNFPLTGLDKTVLGKELLEFLDQHHQFHGSVKVPTVQFFNNRTVRLVHQMTALVQMEYGASPGWLKSSKFPPINS